MDSVLIHLLCDQESREVVEIFMKHLRSFNSQDLECAVWDARNKLRNHGAMIVMRHRDFTGKDAYMMDYIPRALRRKHDYMFEQLDLSESSVIHTVLSKSCMNIHADVIRSLTFFKQHMQHELYQRYLWHRETYNGETYVSQKNIYIQYTLFLIRRCVRVCLCVHVIYKSVVESGMGSSHHT